MTRAPSPRTARRIARAVAACFGGIIGGVMLDRPELAAIAAGVLVAILLSFLLHLHRQPKGNRR